MREGGLEDGERRRTHELGLGIMKEQFAVGTFGTWIEYQCLKEKKDSPKL